MSNKKILVVYFSKTGAQYSVGNITEGVIPQLSPR